jgi:SCO1/SenC
LRGRLPHHLATLADARSRLGEAADTVQVIYVTVDPERDDAAHMKDYLAAFDPSFRWRYRQARGVGDRAPGLWRHSHKAWRRRRARGIARVKRAIRGYAAPERA